MVVILTSMSACLNEQIIGPTGPTIIFLPIGTRVDTVTPSCIRTSRIYTSDSSNVVGDTIVLPVGESDTLRVDQTFAPAGCDTPDSFRWETSNSAVVAVVRLDNVSGRITGIGAGTAVVTAVSEQTSTLRLTANVKVPGSTTPTVSTINYTPTTGVVAVGDTVTLTAQVVHGTDIPASQPASPVWYSTNTGAWTVVATATGSAASGMTAKLVRRSTGSATICIQWSPTRLTPTTCHTWP